ncbi:hypothetical protein XENOCAPTIV_028580 [Xenoophorus captivus]|uniref:Uncharacterized protein n=1 Tax=Xenoophorus captivus TaxID=1517983 RepID=A0ABV0S143_9TELE
MRPPSPTAMKQRPLSPQPTSAKPPPIQKPSLTPTGPPTLRKRDSKSKDLGPVQPVAPQASDASKTKDKDGTASPINGPLKLSSPVLKSHLVEGSEFLNEEDSTKEGLVSSLNGKSSQWSFEELIDTNVHSKTRPLIESEDCNQVLINCDGSADGTRVAFEDKGTSISTLHSSNQPIEAMSGEVSLHCFKR